MSKKDQRELYRSAFSHLHASDALDWEEMNMTGKSREIKGKGFRCRRSMVILAVVLTVLMAMSVIAYAATDGEVLNTVKVWINGAQVDAGAYTQEDGTIKIDLSEGDSIEVESEDWAVKSEGGNFKGGVKIDREGDTEVTIDEVTDEAGE